MNELTKEKAIAMLENLVMTHPGLKLCKKEWDGLEECFKVIKGNGPKDSATQKDKLLREVTNVGQD